MAEQIGGFQPEKIDPVEKTKSLIRDAQIHIEADISRASSGTWLHSLGSIASTLGIYLEEAKATGALSQETSERAELRLEALHEKIENLRKQYAGVKIPPQEVQEELLAELDILKD